MGETGRTWNTRPVGKTLLETIPTPDRRRRPSCSTPAQESASQIRDRYRGGDGPLTLKPFAPSSSRTSARPRPEAGHGLVARQF